MRKLFSTAAHLVKVCCVLGGLICVLKSPKLHGPPLEFILGLVQIQRVALPDERAQFVLFDKERSKVHLAFRSLSGMAVGNAIQTATSWGLESIWDLRSSRAAVSVEAPPKARCLPGDFNARMNEISADSASTVQQKANARLELLAVGMKQFVARCPDSVVLPRVRTQSMVGAPQ